MASPKVRDLGHPHDDRVVSLGLHHTIDTGIAHDVIVPNAEYDWPVAA